MPKVKRETNEIITPSKFMNKLLKSELRDIIEEKRKNVK